MFDPVSIVIEAILFHERIYRQPPIFLRIGKGWLPELAAQSYVGFNQEDSTVFGCQIVWLEHDIWTIDTCPPLESKVAEKVFFLAHRAIQQYEIANAKKPAELVIGYRFYQALMDIASHYVGNFCVSSFAGECQIYGIPFRVSWLEENAELMQAKGERRFGW